MSKWRYTKVGGQSRDWQIVTEDTGAYIGQASQEKHAERIVECVNAWDDVSALRARVEELNNANRLRLAAKVLA